VQVDAFVGSQFFGQGRGFYAAVFGAAPVAAGAAAVAVSAARLFGSGRACASAYI